MPEYLHPGVYIEEQPAPQSIEGVSTSTAGFVGATLKGPTTGLPRLVTSFADFKRIYGSYLPESPWGNTRFFAYSVEGFFNNGGLRAYIARVVGPNAGSSTVTLNDGFVTRLASDTANELANRNTARLESLRGVAVGISLTFEQDFNGTVETQTEQVTAYAAATKTVTLQNPLSLRYTVSGCKVTSSATAEVGNPSITITASSQGAWGDAIQVVTRDVDAATGVAQAPAGVATTLLPRQAQLGAGNGPAAGVTSIANVDAGIRTALAVADGDQIEISDGASLSETATVQTVDAAADTLVLTGPLANDYSGGAVDATLFNHSVIHSGDTNPVLPVQDVTGFQAGNLATLRSGATSQNVAINAVDNVAQTITLNTATLAITHDFASGTSLLLATAGNSGTTVLNVASGANYYNGAVIEIDNGTSKQYNQVTAINGRVLTLQSPLSQNAATGDAVRVVEFSLSIVENATDGLSEDYSNLSLNASASNYVETVVNNQSKLVQITVDASGTAIPFNIPRTIDALPQNLGGGLDDVPIPDNYIGVDNGPGNRTGIQALGDIDSVSLIAAPGISDPSVHDALMTQCELLADRFAVLDPSAGADIETVLLERNNLDTTYTAIYYPWLQARDPLNPQNPDGITLPPSGHVLGIYARVDNERGVHKAPANEVIRGITGLELKLSDREQDILNPANVNVVRDLRANGRGINVWGARVMTSDNAWKYIPVRRLFIFIEESLDEGLQWVVFEPNGEDLWSRVRRTVSGFLRQLWLNGQLAGTNEDQAFFVRCDRSTMTEDDLANGRLIVLVGVAPLRPAEFVIVRIGQKTLDAE